MEKRYGDHEPCLDQMESVCPGTRTHGVSKPDFHIKKVLAVFQGLC